MFCLFVIVEPIVKLYFVGGDKFSTKKEDAKPYTTREEAMKDQNLFEDLDLQIEGV